ncbi:MAG: hypothetical protein EOO32_00225 [Comamonadaceae bacterium]|nr:MAG: hypothetical protein EOO32_00225 [Comamonadaceae bacterium]
MTWLLRAAYPRRQMAICSAVACSLAPASAPDPAAAAAAPAASPAGVRRPRPPAGLPMSLSRRTVPASRH